MKTEEYNELIEQTKFAVKVRNELFVFSFTAVLAVIGVGFARDEE